MNLQENYKTVQQMVAQATSQTGRPNQSVHVVAVTKYVDSSIAKSLVDEGVQHIGENRVDKFLEKYEALKSKPITWHLIGNLQRRKVKDVINQVDYFHALDSVKLAEEIQKRATRPINCFLEVNISGEESKHGFLLSEIEEALVQMEKLDRVRLVGLMTMAPLGASKEELHHIFSTAKEWQTELVSRQIPNMPFTELSMGMSGDFEEAIANGATYVRIGTAFFK